MNVTTPADHAAQPAATAHPVADLDDLTVGSLRMVRIDGRRVCLVRTEQGVHALDHACPHEGYGLTQGTLDGDVLTCAWHNWKFRVTDGRCVLGEEDVRSHRVVVAADGAVLVELDIPDPAEERARLTASLGRAIARDYLGQIARDTVRLLRAGAPPEDLVWQAVEYGAPRAEFGWGHEVAAAADCLAMLDLYSGDERALPVVQAIAGLAEEARDRPVQPVPAPLPALPDDAAGEFRRLVERERTDDAQALVRAGVAAGLTPGVLIRWFAGPISDHLLAYGHGAIYVQKAFQLLERVGSDPRRADLLLTHLVASIISFTREDTLPYMRPFLRALGQPDFEHLAALPTDPNWSDDGSLLAALLGSDRAAPATATLAALRDGAGVEGVLAVVVEAVSQRLLRYDTAGELDMLDDFGWLDITHGLTHANAVRWFHRQVPGADTVRMAVWVAFLAHWTGRHEWHTRVADPIEPGDATADLVAACRSHRERDAVAAAAAGDPATVARDLQRAALLDGTTAPIVHAHAVKMAVAAAEEAEACRSRTPLVATARFLAAPKLERFVAAVVARSIDHVAHGRRDDPSTEQPQLA